MSAAETNAPAPCRICVGVERKRIDDSFNTDDAVELLDHLLKEHYDNEDVRDFIAEFGGEETCANCGEEFYTTYRAAGVGIVRDTYCPGCISREPLWELSVTRVDAERWFNRQKAKRERTVSLRELLGEDSDKED